MVVNIVCSYLAIRLTPNVTSFCLGGLAELGEHLDEAVIREVREETGIPCRFLHVLAVRHTHAGQFNRSDLYFVCLLEPITDTDGKLPEPTPQPGEIAAVAWLPMVDYRNMVFSEDKNVGHPMMQRIVEVLDNSSQIERFVVPSIVPGRKQSPLSHAPINSKNNR